MENYSGIFVTLESPPPILVPLNRFFKNIRA